MLGKKDSHPVVIETSMTAASIEAYLSDWLPDLGIASEDYVLVFVNEIYVETDLGFSSLPARTIKFKNSKDFALTIPADVQVDRPIHLIFGRFSTELFDSNQKIFRRFIQLGKKSRACVIEHYIGDYYETPIDMPIETKTEIALKEGAVLEYIQCMEMDGYPVRSDSVIVRQQANSQWNSRVFTLGGYRVEHYLETHLEGDSSQCDCQGLYLVKGQDALKHRTVIEHVGAHGKSVEYYKGIAANQAQATFHGLICVQPTAQECQAKQTNKNLLLSEKAQINSIPQLEIHNNDVQCQHGSATGDLNPMALFYLKSRGMTEPDARHLLIDAFMDEIMLTFPTEALKQSWREKTHQYLFEGSKNEKL